MLRIKELRNEEKKETINRLIDDIKKKGGESYCFLLLDRKEEEIYGYSVEPVNNPGTLKLQTDLYSALYAFIAGFKRQKYGVVIGKDGNILTLMRLVSGASYDEMAKIGDVTAKDIEDAEKGKIKIPTEKRKAIQKALSFPDNFYPDVEFD